MVLRVLTLRNTLQGWLAQKLIWFQPEINEFSNSQMYSVCLMCERDSMLAVHSFKMINICFDSWNSANSTVVAQCDCSENESVDKNCKSPYDHQVSILPMFCAQHFLTKIPKVQK